MQAGVNFNLHTAGWLEGGLAIGYEKFMLDEDQASMAAAYIGGVDLTDNGLALDAMLAGGPGQHFLGSPHTLANFENAFWRSELSDNNSFEQWELNGAHDAATRANAAWKRRLAEYEMPPLDEGIESRDVSATSALDEADLGHLEAPCRHVRHDGLDHASIRSCREPLWPLCPNRCGPAHPGLGGPGVGLATPGARTAGGCAA